MIQMSQIQILVSFSVFTVGGNKKKLHTARPRQDFKFQFLNAVLLYFWFILSQNNMSIFRYLISIILNAAKLKFIGYNLV